MVVQSRADNAKTTAWRGVSPGRERPRTEESKEGQEQQDVDWRISIEGFFGLSGCPTVLGEVVNLWRTFFEAGGASGCWQVLLLPLALSP